MTEELPSSGSSNHEHQWQKVDGGGDDKHDMLVCKHEDCSKSKLVEKPKVQEADQSGKSLLLG